MHIATKWLAGLALWGAAGVCAAGSGWLRLTGWEDTRFEDALAGQGEAIERRLVDAGWRRERPDREWGARYAHQRLLIRAGDPATNGYLHQFDLDGSWRRGPREIRITTGLHGSSNLFRHGRAHRDAWVTTFTFRNDLPRPEWRLGVAGDYRFGAFRTYPMLAWEHPFAGGELEVELPVRLAWSAPDRRWSLALDRYGEKWGTLDGARERPGKQYLREWRLGGTLQVPVGRRGIRLELGAGVSFDTRVSYLDLGDGRRDVRLADRVYLLVGVHR